MAQLILCIEDDPLAAQAIRRTLAFAGFEVQVAGTAAQAMDLLQTRRPVMILLDLLLPDVNGYSFMDLLRDHEDLDKIPVMIVSGCASPEAQSLGRELGACAYMIKPFTAQELIDRVHEVLGIKQRAEKIVGKGV
jgi:DNA-binding response OmpR family regulator